MILWDRTCQKIVVGVPVQASDRRLDVFLDVLGQPPVVLRLVETDTNAVGPCRQSGMISFSISKRNMSQVFFLCSTA